MLLVTFSNHIRANETKSVVVNKIRDHVYVISYVYESGYINLGVFEGNDGLLLIVLSCRFTRIKH